MRVQSLGQEDPLKEEMAAQSSILAWKILWGEELQSMGSQRGAQDRVTKHTHTHTHTRGESKKLICFSGSVFPSWFEKRASAFGGGGWEYRRPFSPVTAGRQ